ncbi:MAG: InlB B-repeat-containing protein [Patescibacteria group bacterium]
MNLNKAKIVLSVFLLTNFLFSGLFSSINFAKANNNKTITITFAATPTPGLTTVTKAPLKYNKDFAFSYAADDGYIEGYNPIYHYFNGGYISADGSTVGGLYYTNGAGYRIPFTGSFNWFSNSGTTFSDLHVNTPSNMTWDNLRETYASGWEPINHGWTSINTPDPTSTIINYPAPHGPSTIDYSYEVSQNTLRLFQELGVTVKHFGLPNGDKNYTSAAWANGMKTVYEGQTTSALEEKGVNVTNSVSLSNLLIHRFYFEENKSTNANMKAYIDNLANESRGGNKFWGVASNHRVVVGAGNGNLSFDKFKYFMDYLENTYGANGDDSVWMASSPEVYEYLSVKQNTVVSSNLVGNVLTVDLDSSAVDTDLRRYALSLLVSSDATISSISYGSGFTAHSDNKTTGLINLDWGQIFTANDLTRVSALVTTAEANKSVSSVNNARTYTNLLNDTTQLADKNTYNARLNAIVVPLRTWKIDTGTNGSSVGVWNSYSAITATSSPLTGLLDSDGCNASCGTFPSISISRTMVKYGFGATTTPADTGIYPDAMMKNGVYIRTGTGGTGGVKISGLNTSKTYNIKLFGSTVTNSADNKVTVYSIYNKAGTKEQNTYLNTSTTTVFAQVAPEPDGTIEVLLTPKVTAWGYALLNVMEVEENLLPAPTGLSYPSPNVYVRNSSITPISPTITGSGITYSVNPTLPAGLTFSTSTGIISGTPTEAVNPSYYNVTATNNGGNTSFAVLMTVNNIAPGSLSYSSPHTYTKDSSITPLTPTITGQGLTYSVSPDLPTGITLDPDTGIISGTPTISASQNTYTITATNSGGSSTFGLVMTVNSVYSLSYTAGAGGTISGTSTQLVVSGSNGTPVTPVANANYHFVNWSDASTSSPRTDTNVTNNISVTANFSINTHNLVYTAGAGGSLAGTTTQSVTHGSNGTPVTPVANANYHFVNWSDASTSSPRTDTNVIDDISVTANFSIDIHNLVYSAGINGSITGTTTQSVAHGANGTPVTAVPSTNYHFVKWSDDVMTAARTDLNVTGNISVTAQFAINTFSLSYSSGSGGTISGTTTQTINYGSNGTPVTPVANANYHFVNWSDASTSSPRTDTNVTNNISVTANFAINTHNVNYAAGTNGSITGTLSQIVNHGSNGTTVTASPNANYHFVNWSDDLMTATRTDLNVNNNISVTANFAINTYDLVYFAGTNGSITGTTTQSVAHDSNGTSVTAVPNANYHFVKWSDDVTTATRTDLNVINNISVTAQFVRDSSGSSYSLNYAAGIGGIILGSSTQMVGSGDSGTSVTATPDNGYRFLKWSDNVLNSTRTETNVTNDYSVTADFELIPIINSSPVTLPAGVGNGLSDHAIPMNSVGDIGSITNGGINMLGYINSQANFSAPESANGWQSANHNFQISKLDLANNFITLIISSKPQTITLKKYEVRDVDLDGDKKNDIRLTFAGTYNNRVEITVKSLSRISADPVIIAPSVPAIKKFVFKKDLKSGVTNSDVTELQKYLNVNGYLVAKMDAGSPGKETSKFGAATKAALIKFQKKNKINPAIGIFGPVTRKMINNK